MYNVKEIQKLVFGLRNWTNEVSINQDEGEREKQVEGEGQECGQEHVSLRYLSVMSHPQWDNESGVKGRSPGWRIIAYRWILTSCNWI